MYITICFPSVICVYYNQISLCYVFWEYMLRNCCEYGGKKTAEFAVSFALELTS